MNSVDENRRPMEIFSDTNVRIYHNGVMDWNPMALLKGYCILNVRRYPFDTQRCSLKFGPWTYPVNELDLFQTSDEATLAAGFYNNEWNLKGAPVVKYVTVYPSGSNYSSLIYTLILERKPLFILYNLLFPCCLILAIALTVFFLPPDSDEKVSLGVTLVLAMTVFLLMVQQQMPPSGDAVPMLSKYDTL